MSPNQIPFLRPLVPDAQVLTLYFLWPTSSKCSQWSQSLFPKNTSFGPLVGFSSIFLKFGVFPAFILAKSCFLFLEMPLRPLCNAQSLDFFSPKCAPFACPLSFFESSKFRSDLHGTAKGCD